MTIILNNPIAYWQTEYETGNKKVDEQHQEIFGIVNALHDAVVTKTDVEILERILHHLASHTVEHFKTEEALMLTVDYPDYDRHKLTHDLLLSKVANLLRKVSDRDIEMTTDITQFLTDWLAHHIQGEDQKMIQFFQAKI
jgi:hemerythrin